MTIDETNILHKKAESRKDGVYSYKNNLWAVKNGKFVAFANLAGECFQRMGAFNVKIGGVERYDSNKKLKDWLKTFN